MKRENISNRTRFLVLKRDNFTCQYCGRSGIELEVDHIHPFSKGGTNEIGNLITACKDCNRGKIATEVLPMLNEYKTSNLLGELQKSINGVPEIDASSDYKKGYIDALTKIVILVAEEEKTSRDAGRPPKAKERAKFYILENLSQGRKPIGEFQRFAKLNGIAEKTFRNAKEELISEGLCKIVKESQGQRKGVKWYLEKLV